MHLKLIVRLRIFIKVSLKHFNGKEVFVLIDEYDAPINNAIMQKVLLISNKS